MVEVVVEVGERELSEILDFIRKHFELVNIEQVERISSRYFSVVFSTSFSMQKVVQVLRENGLLHILKSLRPSLLSSSW